MPVNLSRDLKHKQDGFGAERNIQEYEEGFRVARDAVAENDSSDDRMVSVLYYDLVTDFYEYGWGRSFHFAPRVPGESFEASLVRHERYLARVLGLKPGMVVADVGCGVGGPLMEIARFSGATIVGVNSNAYQLERARERTEEAGLTHLVEFLECDFLNVDAADESFDAVYDIEATCHAPDKLSIYGEIFRLLKPGGCFGGYQYCLTDRFDANDPHHLRIKADIQLGGSLFVIDDTRTVDQALRTVGFEVLEARDLSIQNGPSIPWYQPLIGSGFSLTGFRRSRIGRWVTRNSLRSLEALHIAPQGSARVAATLDLCAEALAEAGRIGIFTPMYLVHARKPA